MKTGLACSNWFLEMCVCIPLLSLFHNVLNLSSEVLNVERIVPDTPSPLSHELFHLSFQGQKVYWVPSH